MPYGPAKRNLARWRWYLILALVSSPLLYFVGKTVYASILVEAPGVVNQEQITARALAHGYIEDIYVKPLQQVESGQPLARLANPELTLRRQQLRSEVSELERLTKSTGDGGLRSSIQAQMSLVRSQHADARERAEAMEDLAAQGAATEAEVAQARSDYQQLLAQSAALSSSVAATKRDSSSVDIKTKLVSTKAELADLDQQLNQLVIRAPKNGRVVDIPVTVGDQLSLGSVVAMLVPNEGEMHVDSYLAPRHAAYAARGRIATVLFPDGTHVPARVIDVPEIAQELPASHAEWFGSRELGVVVRLKFLDQNLPQALTNGLPVKVRFGGQWNTPDTDGVGLTQRLSSTWDAMLDRFNRWAA